MSPGQEHNGRLERLSCGPVPAGRTATADLSRRDIDQSWEFPYGTPIQPRVPGEFVFPNAAAYLAQKILIHDRRDLAVKAEDISQQAGVDAKKDG